MKRYVQRSCDSWRILSAEHGLLNPGQTIEPYEKTLKTMRRQEQREWADRVTEAIRTEFPDAMDVSFEVHAGKEYSRDLIPKLLALGYAVAEPIPHLQFGKRLQWYDRNMPPARSAAIA